jgi:cytochrome c553
MHKTISLLMTALILTAPYAALGESPATETGTEVESVTEVKSVTEVEIGTESTDMRKFVEMPEQARQVLREDMLDQFAVLNEIIEYLALNDLPGAAAVAENGMGQSLLRKHEDRDFGPGRYMPEAMRRMGWNLHEAASNFSLIAKRGNVQAAYGGLQKITEACIACHYNYRTR